jgi:transcription elongation factor Elf1
MEIRYSCACGARNRIRVEKAPPHGEPTFFYCHACGRPSWDHCTRCGFNARAGSEYRFCKGCGASAESIQAGVETLDFNGTMREVFMFLGACLILGILYHCYGHHLRPYQEAFNRQQLLWTQRMPGYVPLGLISLIPCWMLFQKLTGPCWGLTKGKAKVSLFWQEFAVRGPAPLDADDVNAGTRRGRWLRTKLKRHWAALWRGNRAASPPRDQTEA